jgi:glycosyltransferase involved in cell wall biosynthesis
MRPWLIASGDFTTLGGMDRANHALASHLAQHGREVHLVTHRVASDLADRSHVHVHSAPRPAGAHLLGAPFLARETARQALALGPAAAVLVNGGNASIPAPTWVHYLHAAYEPVIGGSLRTRVSVAASRRWYLRSEASAIRRAPLIVCNSHRTADDVARRYGAGPRTRVVYYGAAPDTFAEIQPDERSAARRALGVEDGRLAAVFVGALGDRRKGFDVLFDAWRDLARDPRWDVDLFVAGTGGDRGTWMRRASQTGIGDRIHFLGFRPDIQEVLAAADVLVHPARYEPYGLGIHEALCRGLPAIVSGICGIAEQYPRALAGLIVPEPPEIRGTAVALRAWRSAAADWRARVAPFGAALRSRTWDDMAAEVTAAVEQL